VICSEVDENRQGGSQVHFLVPVTAVSAGDPPRPSPQLASRGIRTAVFTCVAATTKELEKYPNTELVDVTDNTDHVCAAIVNGKLRIDATENQETVVPIAVSVETIRNGVNHLQEVSTGI
jgi:hypothetical protein